MIIICPNCDARYQVASASFGNAGRKVKCANCKSDWKAQPEPDVPAAAPKIRDVAEDVASADKMFGAADEEQLDEEFERAQSQSKNGNQPFENAGENHVESFEVGGGDEIDPEKLAIHRSNLQRRQQSLSRNLPRARIRRFGRMAAIAGLVVFFGGGIYWRDNVVNVLPDTAWLYSIFGMQVNVVGLEFRDVRTLRTTRDGSEIIEISGKIENITGHQISVPSVLIKLIDDQGQSIYEWTTRPVVRVMAAREWIEFSSQLTAPPRMATDLRVSFVEDGNIDESGIDELGSVAAPGEEEIASIVIENEHG